MKRNYYFRFLRSPSSKRQPFITNKGNRNLETNISKKKQSLLRKKEVNRLKEKKRGEFVTHYIDQILVFSEEI